MGFQMTKQHLKVRRAPTLEETLGLFWSMNTTFIVNTTYDIHDIVSSSNIVICMQLDIWQSHSLHEMKLMIAMLHYHIQRYNTLLFVP